MTIYIILAVLFAFVSGMLTVLTIELYQNRIFDYRFVLIVTIINIAATIGYTTKVLTYL